MMKIWLLTFDFIDDETEAQTNNLPRVAQLVNGGAGVWTVVI